MLTHAMSCFRLGSLRALLFAGLISFSFAGARAVTIPTVAVGDSGNIPDQLSSYNNPTGLRFGSVSYDYRIGTTEVTNAQYVEFLNAKAASDPFGLYNPAMESDARGGISRSGISGSFTYAAKSSMDNKPVNYVSWYDAIRFANWLNNGQGNSDTETGAYTLLGGTPIPSNGVSIDRNANATWFLPSENEWYKAAYFQPADRGGDADSYWLYPTASNSLPTVATANTAGVISNPGSNVVNYVGGAQWNGQDGNVTTVGSAGALSTSFYGTLDQGGNIYEWNDTSMSQYDVPSRVIRGGSFSYGYWNLQASLRAGLGSHLEASTIGFRVATIPEPSTYVLAAIGVVALLAVKRRKR